MNRYKVGYFLNGTAYAEHVEVSNELDFIAGCFEAMDMVKAVTPNTTGMTAQKIS